MHLTALNADVLGEVCVRLGVQDTLRLLATCTLLRAVDGDDFFRALAYRLFSRAFWCRASRRSQTACRTWKEELLRIERFQCCVNRLEGKRWTEEEFFEMWCAEEKLIRSK